MTRSSTDPLYAFDPEIERTLRRLRKARNLVVDNSRNSDSVINSNQFATNISVASFSHFAEPGQMENNDRTLKELATPDVVINLGASNIHSWSQLKREDPHKHLKKFHVVCSTMRPQGIPEDYIKMKAFPFSLDGAAKDWLYLQPGYYRRMWNSNLTTPELKNRLTSAPILQAPNWDLPFELMCDASNSALGAVLSQRARVGQPVHVIAYASRTMDLAQQNYTTTEKELLAIVFALDKFRAYLLSSRIIVFSDHAALRYLLKKPDAKPRLIWWMLLLQEFNIEIKDKKGAENLVADHL
ncbi:Retrovirus-related Pol polyprotein from transposon 17.6, partial [Mucuna pruriens]